MIIADYHTHTIYSHGKGTIFDNAQRANELGLQELAITDHGLNHIFFGLRHKKIVKMRSEIDQINKTSPCKVLLGVEANLISKEGDIDIKENEWELFDVVLCGFHKLVWAKNFCQQFSFIGKNDFLQAFNINKGDSLKKENTAALIKAVEKNKIDILSHPNHDMLIDSVEVAKACRDNGTYFEINSKKVHLSDQELFEVAKTGVMFMVDSDAHTSGRVGDFSLSLETIKRVGISSSQIANWDKLPKFRSRG